MVLALDSIIVYVSDMDRSKAWYQDILGLELTAMHGHFATYQLGNVRISLHAAEFDSSGTRSNISMPVFLTENYESTKKSLENKGTKFVYENQIPDARFGTFLDPDGNPLQIIERYQD